MNINHIIKLFNEGILGIEAAEFYSDMGYFFNIKNGLVIGIEKE